MECPAREGEKARVPQHAQQHLLAEGMAQHLAQARAGNITFSSDLGSTNPSNFPFQD